MAAWRWRACGYAFTRAYLKLFEIVTHLTAKPLSREVVQHINVSLCLLLYKYCTMFSLSTYIFMRESRWNHVLASHHEALLDMKLVSYIHSRVLANRRGINTAP
jgi:hypothetical protein